MLPRTNRFLLAGYDVYIFNKLAPRPDFMYKRFYRALSIYQKEGGCYRFPAKGLSNYCHISLILSRMSTIGNIQIVREWHASEWLFLDRVK